MNGQIRQNVDSEHFLVFFSVFLCVCEVSSPQAHPLLFSASAMKRCARLQHFFLHESSAAFFFARMNDERAQLAKGIISPAYIKQALEGTRSRSALLATLLSQRRLLPDGLDDFSIQTIMMELAAMDSNNFLSNAGMGEREGRIFSSIVRGRCWSMSHGVGRRCGFCC